MRVMGLESDPTNCGRINSSPLLTLRHSCASLLIAQGHHPRVVMETLGHSQISLTMNTYAHVLPDAQREAAVTMDLLFPEADEQ